MDWLRESQTWRQRDFEGSREHNALEGCEGLVNQPVLERENQGQGTGQLTVNPQSKSAVFEVKILGLTWLLVTTKLWVRHVCGRPRALKE